MVSQRFPPHRLAGAELHADALAHALVASGVDVEVVTTRRSGERPASPPANGVPIRWLTAARSPFEKPSRFLRAARWVAAARGRFDVVHGHCLSATSLGAAAGAARAGIPVVLQPSLGGPDGEIRKIVASAAAPVMKALLRRIDRFAVLSAGIGDELLALGVSPTRLTPVENGVDLARFTPADEAARRRLRAAIGLRDEPVALFVGQLVARKGIRDLLDVWPAVRAALGDVTLAVVGEGEEAPAVRRLAATPESGLVYLGRRDDVPELLRAATVFVMPSANESFGCAVVEAMACGVPVVVGRTGIAATLPIDGAAGRVVTPRRPGELRDALIALLAAPERHADLGSAGRRLAERFDMARVAGAYVALYREVSVRPAAAR